MEAAMKNQILCIIFIQTVAFYSTQASNVTTASSEVTENEDIYAGKHESFANCPKFDLSPDEYTLFQNRTAYVEAYNMTYTEEFYILDGEILTVCMPIDEATGTTHTLTSNSLSLLTTIGIGVSMVCLLIHLVVFALVPDLQNLPGCNLASLCFSLFLSYLLMIVNTTEHVFENRVACVTVAGMMQFFFLASFLWMFIMSYDVFRAILRATGNLRNSSKGFKAKKYLYRSLVVWGTSLIFTGAAMVVDNLDGVHESYKPQFDEFCWFKQKQSLLVFFAGPVFTLICLNLILFGISAYNIFSNRMRSTQDSHCSNLKKSHMMYFRLAVIMGVTWITGALAPLANVLWLWYLFAALNTFQGFFIFLAFTCTSKVKKHFRTKLFGGRRSSEQNLSPTFQSYCFYSNSIEKDLDKVVAPKDGSEKIDTVVIHL